MEQHNPLKRTNTPFNIDVIYYSTNISAKLRFWIACSNLRILAKTKFPGVKFCVPIYPAAELLFSSSHISNIGHCQISQFPIHFTI